ncbi:MAG: septum site-determining protein MinC [Oculatellaceae cyanobacterium Prado106]|jgi:septum site-determining protein MinC|nr:septum site-determining protein MinC [Oculatellaceae cyanobacterium Prado106]
MNSEIPVPTVLSDSSQPSPDPANNLANNPANGLANDPANNPANNPANGSAQSPLAAALSAAEANRPAEANLPAEVGSPAEATPSPVDATPQPQVRFKGEGGRLLLMLPPDTDAESMGLTWYEIWQQLKQRLNAGDRFWQPNTPVHLIGRDRLLDSRQLQDIADVLSENGLQLKRIYTSRRQTAVAAATAGLSVEQHPPATHLTPAEAGQALAEPLYLQMTLRSGIEIRHPGSVIVLGDANPGSSIIADGDIIVWGSLRGVAQAGASGNTRCMIMALRLEPTQIRISDFVARAPEVPPGEYLPEVAYVSPEGIRITRASEFSREWMMAGTFE